MSEGFWHCKEQDLNAQLYINSYILVIAMSKWPKYKLHDKETKSDSNLTTWIYTWREMNRRLINIIVTEIREQLNDLIKIKTEYGTIQCCSVSELLLNRPDSTLVCLALTAAGLEQF